MPYFTFDVSPTSGDAPLEVTVTISSDYEFLDQYVLWGDGDFDLSESPTATSWNHTYNTPGSYTIYVDATTIEGTVYPDINDQEVTVTGSGTTTSPTTTTTSSSTTTSTTGSTSTTTTTPDPGGSTTTTCNPCYPEVPIIPPGLTIFTLPTTKTIQPTVITTTTPPPSNPLNISILTTTTTTVKPTTTTTTTPTPVISPNIVKKCDDGCLYLNF